MQTKWRSAWFVAAGALVTALAIGVGYVAVGQLSKANNRSGGPTSSEDRQAVVADRKNLPEPRSPGDSNQGLAGGESRPFGKGKAEAEVAYWFLTALNFPVDAIPTNCRIWNFPADALPVKDLRNRSVSTDKEAFRMIDEKGVIDAGQVEAIYFSVYKGGPRGELGIFGWAFRSNDAAAEAHRKLSALYGSRIGQSKLWLTRSNVVWLWRDPTAPEQCFQMFEELVQVAVDRHGG